jgi:2-polyprenyl-6-methoxyphenol hydroxylase-like FAD-dependent oxidoreductase
MQQRVLVVGAGPVGLSTAIELSRRGIQCRIIDRSLPRAESESRATAVHARTLELLAAFGVADDILASSRLLRGISVYSGGLRLGRATFDGLDSPYPFVAMLPQAVTEQILRKRLAASGVVIDAPVELVGLAPALDCVRATLRDARGNEVTTTAEWVIGCDGGRSAVRKSMNVGFIGRPITGAYLMDCRLDWARGGPEDDGQNYLGPGKDLVLWQNPKGITRIVLSISTKDPRWRKVPPPIELMQSFLDEESTIGARIREATWTSAFEISNRIVTSYRADRVFLAGDAAHVHDPSGGQGMNVGIQDGQNLAWKLATHLQGWATEDILDSYEQERRPVALSVLEATGLTERMLTSASVPVNNLRDAALSVLTSSALAQLIGRSAIAGLRTDYGESTIVNGREPGWAKWLRPGSGVRLGDVYAFERAPRVGRRAPDASGLTQSGGRRVRLFDVLGGDVRHHLLAFSGLASTEPARLSRLRERVAAIVARRGAFLVGSVIALPPTMAPDATDLVVDHHFEAHARYGAKCECLYVVRPDGYVAFRSLGTDDEAIESYLRRVFTVQ